MNTELLMKRETIEKNILDTKNYEMNLFDNNKTWVLRAIAICKDSGTNATKKNIAKVLEKNSIVMSSRTITNCIEALRSYGIIYYMKTQNSDSDFIAFDNPKYPQAVRPTPYESLTFNLKAFNRLFLNRMMYLIMTYKKMDQTIIDEDRPKRYKAINEEFDYVKLLDDMILNYTSLCNNKFFRRMNYELFNQILTKLQIPFYESMTLVNHIDAVIRTCSVPEVYWRLIRNFVSYNNYHVELNNHSEQFNDILVKGFVIIKEGIDKDWSDDPDDRNKTIDKIQTAITLSIREWMNQIAELKGEIKSDEALSMIHKESNEIELKRLIESDVILDFRPNRMINEDDLTRHLFKDVDDY